MRQFAAQFNFIQDSTKFWRWEISTKKVSGSKFTTTNSEGMTRWWCDDWPWHGEKILDNGCMRYICHFLCWLVLLPIKSHIRGKLSLSGTFTSIWRVPLICHVKSRVHGSREISGLAIDSGCIERGIYLEGVQWSKCGGGACVMRNHLCAFSKQETFDACPFLTWSTPFSPERA